MREISVGATAAPTDERGERNWGLSQYTLENLLREKTVSLVKLRSSTVKQ